MHTEHFAHLIIVKSLITKMRKRERGASRIMPTSAARASVPSPDEHILTVQEALEPLFLALEEEAEIKMVAAAVNAGWSVEDAVAAIDELRRTELLPGDLTH